MRKIIVPIITSFAIVLFGASAMADSSLQASELSDAVIEPGTVLEPLPVEEVDESEIETPTEDDVPRSDVDGTPCPDHYDNPEDYDPESNCIDPNEVVQSDEENQRLLDEMCAAWNSPDHGVWALDPGDVNEEYTSEMNETCNTPEPQEPVDTPEPVVEETPAPELPSTDGGPQIS